MSNTEDIEDIFPLSENQTAFLLTNLKSSHTDPGQLIVRCEFVGKLEKTRFINAWQAVVNKHAALRTTIHWEKTDQPLQVVRANSAVDIEFKECQADESDKDLLHNTQQSFGQRVQLDRAPNHRIILYSIGQTKHIMHWQCHHAFIDGWSTSLVLADLIDLYEKPNESNSNNSSVSTFKDYLKWVNTQNKPQASQLWLERLSKLSLVSVNPTQTVQSASPSYFESELVINDEQLDQFDQLCRSHKLTPSILIQTVWATLLNSLFSAESLSFVLTLSGRSASLPGVEKIVGQLSTALPVLAYSGKKQTFVELAQQIKQENHLLRQHEYLSLGRLSKWGYDVATNGRIFTDNKFVRIPDSLVVVENFTPKSANKHTEHLDFRLKQFRSDVVSLYPLTLVALTANELIRLRLISNHNQIDAPFNAILTDRLKTILFSALANPETSLESLSQNLPPLVTSVPKKTSNFSQSHPETHNYAAAETETHAHLQKIWQETLKTKQKVGIDDNFFNLGGTSVQTVSIYSRIETHFGCALPLASILQAPTIRQLAELIQDPDESQARHLVKIQTQGLKRPVFGIHAQDVLFYRDISAAMGNDQPFYAIQQLDQEQAQLSQYQNLQQMATAYIKEIQNIQPTGPYQIIGLCMGCTVGYEMAFQLSQLGQQVDSLIMIDPDLPEMVFKKRKASVKEILTTTNRKSLNRSLAYSFSKLSGYPLLYQLAIAKGQLRIARKSLSGPLEKRRAQRRLQNWILNKNYEMPAYPGKITIIQSGEYHQSMQPHYDNSPGTYSKQTNIDTHVIPGSHTNIFSPPTVYQTASLIKSAIK